MTIDLDAIRGRRNLLPPLQVGQARPLHSDTLVTWDAIFTKDGDLVAYVNIPNWNTALCALPADIDSLLAELDSARADNARLREALHKLAYHNDEALPWMLERRAAGDDLNDMDWVVITARTALEAEG